MRTIFYILIAASFFGAAASGEADRSHDSPAPHARVGRFQLAAHEPGRFRLPNLAPEQAQWLAELMESPRATSAAFAWLSTLHWQSYRGLVAAAPTLANPSPNTITDGQWRLRIANFAILAAQFDRDVATRSSQVVGSLENPQGLALPEAELRARLLRVAGELAQMATSPPILVREQSLLRERLGLSTAGLDPRVPTFGVAEAVTLFLADHAAFRSRFAAQPEAVTRVLGLLREHSGEEARAAFWALARMSPTSAELRAEPLAGHTLSERDVALVQSQSFSHLSPDDVARFADRLRVEARPPPGTDPARWAEQRRLAWNSFVPILNARARAPQPTTTAPALPLAGSFRTRAANVPFLPEEIAFVNAFGGLTEEARRAWLTSLPIDAFEDFLRRLQNEVEAPNGQIASEWQRRRITAFNFAERLHGDPLALSRMTVVALGNPAHAAGLSESIRLARRAAAAGEIAALEAARADGRTLTPAQQASLAQHAAELAALRARDPRTFPRTLVATSDYLALLQEDPAQFVAQVRALTPARRETLLASLADFGNEYGGREARAVVETLVPAGRRNPGPLPLAVWRPRRDAMVARRDQEARTAYAAAQAGSPYARAMAAFAATRDIDAELRLADAHVRRLSSGATAPAGTLPPPPADEHGHANLLSGLDSPEGISHVLAQVPRAHSRAAAEYFRQLGTRFAALAGTDGHAAELPLVAARTALALRDGELSAEDRGLANEVWRMSPEGLHALLLATRVEAIPALFARLERIRVGLAAHGGVANDPVWERPIAILRDRLVGVLDSAMQSIAGGVRDRNYPSLIATVRDLKNTGLLAQFFVLGQAGDGLITASVRDAVRQAMERHPQEWNLAAAMMVEPRTRALRYRAADGAESVIVPETNPGRRIYSAADYDRGVRDAVARFHTALREMDAASGAALTPGNLITGAQSGRLAGEPIQTAGEVEREGASARAHAELNRFATYWGAPTDFLVARRAEYSDVINRDSARADAARRDIVTYAAVGSALAITLPAAAAVAPALVATGLRASIIAPPFIGAGLGALQNYSVQRARVADGSQASIDMGQVWASAGAGFATGALVSASGPAAPYVATGLALYGSASATRESVRAFLEGNPREGTVQALSAATSLFASTRAFARPTAPAGAGGAPAVAGAPGAGAPPAGGGGARARSELAELIPSHLATAPPPPAAPAGLPWYAGNARGGDVSVAALLAPSRAGGAAVAVAEAPLPHVVPRFTFPNPANPAPAVLPNPAPAVVPNPAPALIPNPRGPPPVVPPIAQPVEHAPAVSPNPHVPPAPLVPPLAPHAEPPPEPLVRPTQHPGIPAFDQTSLDVAADIAQDLESLIREITNSNELTGHELIRAMMNRQGLSFAGAKRELLKLLKGGRAVGVFRASNGRYYWSFSRTPGGPDLTNLAEMLHRRLLERLRRNRRGPITADNISPVPGDLTIPEGFLRDTVHPPEDGERAGQPFAARRNCAAMRVWYYLRQQGLSPTSGAEAWSRGIDGRPNQYPGLRGRRLQPGETPDGSMYNCPSCGHNSHRVNERPGSAP